MNFDRFQAERGLTEPEFIRIADISQELLDSWRRGTRRPSPDELCDMATAFGVSISELTDDFRFSDLPDHVPALGLAMQPPGLTEQQSLARWIIDRHRFWGHIGLELPRPHHIEWFPISATQAVSLADQLAASEQEFVTTPTLNNRMLVFAPSRLSTISFLAAGDARPRGYTIDEWDGVAGLPPELYRALNRMGLTAVASKADETPAMQRRMAQVLRMRSLRSSRELVRRTGRTTVSNGDGLQFTFVADPVMLRAAFVSQQLGSQTFYVEDQYNSTEYLFATERVCLINMPLIHVKP